MCFQCFPEKPCNDSKINETAKRKNFKKFHFFIFVIQKKKYFKAFNFLPSFYKNQNMFTSETKIRVRYAETDRMGYVYYGNYATYYEVGRVEALRELGFSYKKMEDNGIMLPVFTFSIKYIKPAYYDDLLTVKTIIKNLPGARIKFDYEIFNEEKELLNTGETSLVFINKEMNKPCSAPEFFMNAIRKYF